MNVFTFDNIYFFKYEVLENPEWYVFTHPSLELMHGYFDVGTGCYSSRFQPTSEIFDAKEILEIETILSIHKDEMNAITISKAHKKMPIHYKLIDKKSKEYVRLNKLLRTAGCECVPFSISYEKACADNPAYRLNRSYVRSIINEIPSIPEDEIEKNLLERTEDSWMYDVSPYKKDGDTYEQYHKDYREIIKYPTPIDKRYDQTGEFYYIEGLPGVLMVDYSKDKRVLETRHFIQLEARLIEPIGFMGIYIL